MRKNISAIISIGATLSSSVSKAFGGLNSHVTALGESTQALMKKQRELNAQAAAMGNHGGLFQKSIDAKRQEVELLEKQIQQHRRLGDAIAKNQRQQSENLAKREHYKAQIGEVLALGVAIGAPIKAAADFEDAMLGVAKQVEGARDASGNLTPVYFGMRREIQGLAEQMPITTNEIAAMVTEAARMGVANEHLMGFVKTSAMMAEAFELPAGQLAADMGKIANLYKIPMNNIEELADTINFLDDNAISSSGGIIDVLTRVGGMSSMVKITSKDMAALSSTLLSLGERAEPAGTAINSIFTNLAAAESGTDRMMAAFDAIGMSASSIQQGMQDDAVGTLLNVIEAIKTLPKDQHIGVMTGMVGKEHADTLAKLVGNTEELRKQLELANSEAAKGSVSREYEARLKNFTSQMEMFGSKIRNLGINIGTVILPMLNGMMAVLGPIASGVAKVAERFPFLTQVVVGLGAGLGLLKIATFGYGLSMTYVRGQLLKFEESLLRKRAAALLTTASLSPAGVAVRAFGAALMATPIGWIVGGLMALVGVGILIYRHWAPIGAFFKGFGSAFMAAIAPITPLRVGFEMAGKAIGFIGDALNSILSPAQYTTEELKNAGEMGKKAGEFIGSGFVWAAEKVEGFLNGIGKVLEKIPLLGSVFKKLGAGSFGTYLYGKKEVSADQTLPAGASAGGAALPNPPAANKTAALRGDDNRKYEFNIQTQPGQNEQQVANAVMKQLNAQDRRAADPLYDGATA